MRFSLILRCLRFFANGHDNDDSDRLVDHVLVLRVLLRRETDCRNARGIVKVQMQNGGGMERSIRFFHRCFFTLYIPIGFAAVTFGCVIVLAEHRTR